mmetsp:Transcript_2685/g.8173  ORF Transcript_2685/g.8173 Transcript_2685/m.8173 type:complete len:105 (-) Transcript_2685:68-382(-)
MPLGVCAGVIHGCMKLGLTGCSVEVALHCKRPRSSHAPRQLKSGVHAWLIDCLLGGIAGNSTISCAAMAIVKLREEAGRKPCPHASASVCIPSGSLHGRNQISN